MTDILNDKGEWSNELATIDYYHDDRSMIKIHNIVIEDEAISLFNAQALMEEVNINDINDLIDDVSVALMQIN